MCNEEIMAGGMLIMISRCNYIQNSFLGSKKPVHLFLAAVYHSCIVPIDTRLKCMIAVARWGKVMAEHRAFPRPFLIHPLFHKSNEWDTDKVLKLPVGILFRKAAHRHETRIAEQAIKPRRNVVIIHVEKSKICSEASWS